MFGYWKRRAITAEAALAEATEALTAATLRMSERAAVLSVVYNGNSTMTITFIRGKELIPLTVHAPMDISVAELKKVLCE
jgi:hypothetical protein